MILPLNHFLQQSILQTIQILLDPLNKQKKMRVLKAFYKEPFFIGLLRVSSYKKSRINYFAKEIKREQGSRKQMPGWHQGVLYETQ